jgi:hypothetical protein
MADQAENAETEGVEYEVIKDVHLPSFAENEYP